MPEIIFKNNEGDTLKEVKDVKGRILAILVNMIQDSEILPKLNQQEKEKLYEIAQALQFTWFENGKP